MSLVVALASRGWNVSGFPISEESEEVVTPPRIRFYTLPPGARPRRSSAQKGLAFARPRKPISKISKGKSAPLSFAYYLKRMPHLQAIDALKCDVEDEAAFHGIEVCQYCEDADSEELQRDVIGAGIAQLSDEDVEELTAGCSAVLL